MMVNCGENDLCLKINCQHNGTCQRLPMARTKCLCLEQWDGQECEDDVNECLNNASNLCLNNGTCLNSPGGYTCQCQENYLGRNCERKHVCLGAFTVFKSGTMSSRWRTLLL